MLREAAATTRPIIPSQQHHKKYFKNLVGEFGLGTITTNTVLTDKGIQSQRNISVRTNSKGDRLYTGIWYNERAPSELRPAYAGFELVHQPPQEANREP